MLLHDGRQQRADLAFPVPRRIRLRHRQQAQLVADGQCQLRRHRVGLASAHGFDLLGDVRPVDLVHGAPPYRVGLLASPGGYICIVMAQGLLHQCAAPHPFRFAMTRATGAASCSDKLPPPRGPPAPAAGQLAPRARNASMRAITSSGSLMLTDRSIFPGMAPHMAAIASTCNLATLLGGVAASAAGVPGSQFSASCC